mmetsp:Transcript_33186/g.105078  ORF Transcript_33186/g.105078 Transcript_33186/m.105078 type:complete len:273 (-) Transcript_33186:68-886(-)
MQPEVGYGPVAAVQDAPAGVPGVSSSRGRPWAIRAGASVAALLLLAGLAAAALGAPRSHRSPLRFLSPSVEVITADASRAAGSYPLPGARGMTALNIKAQQGFQSRVQSSLQWVLQHAQDGPKDLLVLASNDLASGGCSQSQLLGRYHDAVKDGKGAPVIAGKGAEDAADAAFLMGPAEHLLVVLECLHAVGSHDAAGSESSTLARCVRHNPRLIALDHNAALFAHLDSSGPQTKGKECFVAGLAPSSEGEASKEGSLHLQKKPDTTAAIAV